MIRQLRGLCERLDALPTNLYCRRLGKKLLSRVVFLSPAARAAFLPRFLCPRPDGEEGEGGGGLVPSSVFSRHLAPELGRAWCVHEVALRLALLQHLPAYAPAFSIAVLQNVILPEACLLSLSCPLHPTHVAPPAAAPGDEGQE